MTVTLPRLFVGCSASHGEPLSDIIAEVARVTIPGPYSLHGHPATHAFVVVGHEDGLWWRLDAAFPKAHWHPWATPQDPTATALWELRLTQENVYRGIHKARALDGTPYDMLELAAQLSRALATRQWVPNARICTTLVCDVMTACDTVPEGVVVTLPDRQPERLCQALHAREGNWWLHREM